ncbi:hypothetical protein BV394_02695 [Brevirhabdus pacifica]|uniref:Uncharacterized protein n=1 Tax=Brevirhabdus pacifica TaxID=1267768 RepID=A0A1U7DFM1_9RHOB|nr:hypothetical protein [Brevirhabdus pacifica]APX88772.1 hypothetical protein BV394_02695 [Brevirhabdus pacifica]OWU80025.1 hypothetical protein ATO5_03375 [Loktanella sp. 22II-4b]PJJ86701.1 hypothetical protein CLV77_1255 [Brevirhabdus pacifica]
MDDKGPVRRRRVFYIPGYDPFHPRRYRELYRKESARQTAISGHEIALSPGGREGRYGWRVEAVIEGEKTRSDFEVLVWSDLVRESMDPGILRTYLLMLRTAWLYIGSGALWRLFRMRKGPVIAALYPVLFLVVQLLVALAVAAGLGLLLARFLPEGLGWLGWAALVVVPPILGWFKRHDNKVFAYYLMHDYAYSAAHRGANPPLLEGRMTEFTAVIRAALDEDLDEVLVVGHSSGAHLGVSILADLLRDGPLPEGAPALSFLSLGQVVPMVSFLPAADRLRADLRYLSEQDQVPWVDVTAPGDGCAFALCDPVAVSGVATPRQRWPLVLTAAFTLTLSPERWKALRWRFFRLHFQYLCAFDRVRDYDYFAITAGPRTLGARFAGRAATPSRIARPLSPYRSVAA